MKSRGSKGEKEAEDDMEKDSRGRGAGVRPKVQREVMMKTY